MVLLQSTPSFPTRESLFFDILSVEDEERRSLRRPLNYLIQREFELNFELLLECEKDDILNIFLEQGQGGVFQIIPPDEVSQIDVQFVEGSLQIQQASANNYSLSVRVREAFCN